RWQSAAQFRDALDGWIRRTTRVSTRDLANHIGRVINSPTADLEDQVDMRADVAVVEGGPSGLSGPMTRMHLAAAEAEVKQARAEYISGEAVPAPLQDPESSGILTITGDDLMP